MSPNEFDLFSTYLYLFGNKRVKYKLKNFPRNFLMLAVGVIELYLDPVLCTLHRDIVSLVITAG
jgi:hypothetical protein